MSESDGYVMVEVSSVGLDQRGLVGLMTLTSTDSREFHMTAFSPEVACLIEMFRRGDRTSVPSVYKLIEELAEAQSLFLREVQVYSSHKVLRANLYFEGREKPLTLRNYRASDSIALAVYYGATIKLENNLFDEKASSVI